MEQKLRVRYWVDIYIFAFFFNLVEKKLLIVKNFPRVMQIAKRTTTPWTLCCVCDTLIRRLFPGPLGPVSRSSR